MSIPKSKTIALLVVVGFLTAACNDEGGSASVDGLSSIVGIYDWSDTYDGGVVDEWYIGIDAEGNVSDYDYNGDSFDMGSNCYYIDRDWEQLTHVSGSTFNTQNFGEVTVTKNSSGLTITAKDDGELLIVTGEKVTMSESDFEAADCFASNSTPARTVKNDGRIVKK